MNYFQIGNTWWQSVASNGRVIDVMEKPNGVAIITDINMDPLGPRIGHQITEQQFKSKLNQTYENYFSSEKSNP